MATPIQLRGLLQLPSQSEIDTGRWAFGDHRLVESFGLYRFVLRSRDLGFVGGGHPAPPSR